MPELPRSIGEPEQEYRLSLIESRDSAVCPACAGEKAAGQPLCGQCRGALSARTAKRLYAKVGGGYEAALRAALRELARRHAIGMAPGETARRGANGAQAGATPVHAPADGRSHLGYAGTTGAESCEMAHALDELPERSLWRAYELLGGFGGLECDCPYCGSPTRWERQSVAVVSGAVVPAFSSRPVLLAILETGLCALCHGMAIGLSAGTEFARVRPSESTGRSSIVLYPPESRSRVPGSP